MNGGVYIHVPFCKSRCIYCDFYSTTQGQEFREAYVDALCREMVLRRSEINSSRVPSLYIGGGTPSQLSIHQLNRIFACIAECFNLQEDAEVTIEANPEDVTEAWLENLQSLPVNRISMGVQTFSDDLLCLLRRRHTASKAIAAVELCRRYGFHNISIDLIYGLPGQTMDVWKSDVEQALLLQVPHLSSYALSYEEGTALSLMLERGEICQVEDELSWQMYMWLMQETERAGMEHYEISNFCMPGMHSRHNSSYWQSKPYLGLGPGAHSYDGKFVRRANLPDLRDYVTSSGDVPHETEVLSESELYDELVMTRLRTAEGLPLDLLSEEERTYCLKMSQSHLKGGRMVFDNGRLRLTKEGIFVSNDIICDLMR